jgi:hypothetical protein
LDAEDAPNGEIGCFLGLFEGFLDEDCASRVRARISKGALDLRRALTTEPPCLPVAPVMKIALAAMVEDFEGLKCSGGDDSIL